MNEGMKYCFLLLLLFCYSIVPAQSYKKLHKKAIVTDSHNDILSTCIEKHYSFNDNLKGKTHSDLKRMREGGIDVQVFSIWCDASFGKGQAFKRAIQEIDTLYAAVARNPTKMKTVKNYADLQDALKHHQLAAMMGVEGGHMTEDNIAYLDSFHQRGACYMTLTWNNSTSWATSARDESHDSLLHQQKGLNDF